MHAKTIESLAGEPVATAKTERPAGHRWTVSGRRGRVAYDQLGNHLALIDADGDIDSMTRRWADQVAQAVEAGDDDAVYALLAGHYGRELTGGAVNVKTICVRCQTADAAPGTCCSSHEKQLCHLCYRRTHFVEVCVAGCRDCAAEGLPVRLSDRRGGAL